jgi:hypothetical protein
LGQNNCVDAYKSLNLVNTTLNLVNPKDVDFLFLGQAHTNLNLLLGQAYELRQQTTAIQKQIMRTINPNEIRHANCTIS